MPVPDLVFSVLAEHLKRAQTVIEHCMACQDINTRAQVIQGSEKLINIIVDQIVFELGHKDRSRSSVQQFDNLAAFIELLLDHKTGDHLCNALPTELFHTIVDLSHRCLLRLAVDTVPRTVSVKDRANGIILLVVDQVSLPWGTVKGIQVLLLVLVKLCEFLTDDNSV